MGRTSKHRKKLLEIYGNKYKEMLGLENQLWFGKFKGVPIQQIIEDEVTYIEWCLKEKVFILNNKAKLAYQIALGIHYDKVKYGDFDGYGLSPDEVF